VHTKWQSLENRFDEKQKVNSAVDFKEVIKEQMEEEMKKNIAEFTEILVENKLVTSQAQIQEMNRKLEETRSTVLEETDKEARRNNIIIYRIPENESDSNEERKVMDRQYVLKLLLKMQVGIEEADIKGAFRLGRYTRADDAQSGTNSTPMLVQFNNRLAKNLIMENLFKLKHLDSEFKNVIIAHDMTVNERQECRTLVDDVKKKTEEDTSGNYIYRVRGPLGAMSIVRLRRH